jgi:hypothetical protein
VQELKVRQEARLVQELKVRQVGRLVQGTLQPGQSQFLLQQLLPLQEIAGPQERLERLEPPAPPLRRFPKVEFLIHLRIDLVMQKVGQALFPLYLTFPKEVCEALPLLPLLLPQQYRH